MIKAILFLQKFLFYPTYYFAKKVLLLFEVILFILPLGPPSQIRSQMPRGNSTVTHVLLLSSYLNLLIVTQRVSSLYVVPSALLGSLSSRVQAPWPRDQYQLSTCDTCKNRRQRRYGWERYARQLSLVKASSGKSERLYSLLKEDLPRFISGGARELSC